MPFETVKPLISKGLLNSNNSLFELDVIKNELYNLYLDNLPEDIRQEHTCHCCRNFINNYGHVVSYDSEGSITSLWDTTIENEYSLSFNKMHHLLTTRSIKNLFTTQYEFAGIDHNFQLIDGVSHRWDHFSSPIHTKHLIHGNGSKVNDFKSNHKNLVTNFNRCLTEFTLPAIKTVIELIEGGLYRGREKRDVLIKLNNIKTLYDVQSSHIFPWIHFNKRLALWGSSIGVLIKNISDGLDVSVSVSKYEAMVAPQNYKRSKSIVTHGMIDKAREKLSELGYEQSIYRRFATSDDLTIDNLIYIDRGKFVEADPFTDISNNISPNIRNLTHCTMDQFLTEVVPQADFIEIKMDIENESNLMSLLAPVHEDSPSLFKWPSKLSWDYNGNVTDSIRDRVQKAGGSVTGELRASLSWFNKDDLDIHVYEPDGNRIFYSEPYNKSRNGLLDVDMNVTNPVENAVENIVFKDRYRTLEGTYRVDINNYTKVCSDPKKQGFTVQLECHDVIMDFTCNQMLSTRQTIEAVQFNYSHTGGISNVKTKLQYGSKHKAVWGLEVDRFHEVTHILKSPNYWDDISKGEGNLHHFFILKDAINDTKARGIYNEYLCSELYSHRKVFEVLAASLNIESSNIQLSGLGFSSTQKGKTFIARVNNKDYKVTT